MHILVSTSGGFAGLRLEARLDTAALPAAEADLVERAARACLADPPAPDPRTRDARTVRLVADGESASFQEHRAPPDWTVLATAMPLRPVPSRRNPLAREQSDG